MGKPKTLTKLGPLATFDPDKFTALIQKHGFWYRWSRAMTCPCRLNQITDQWDPTCTYCGGDGFMYINPCADLERHIDRDYTRIQAVFSNVKDEKSITEDFGEFDFGEAQLTMHNELRVGYRDRFVSEEQLIAYNELVIRGAADDVPVGKTGYSRDIQRTALRYEPVEVNYIAKIDSGGTRTIYWKGTDWILKAATFDKPSRLSWLPGQGPAEGELYSVHYTMHPVWVVDSGVYVVQHARGPASGIKGVDIRQLLPTTFKVKLDFLTHARPA